MAPPESRCEGQNDSHTEDDRADQSRSRFPMVRRQCNKYGNFFPWFAEVTKPKEIGGGIITIHSIETDVEAAVVASVVVHIFETKRDPKNYIKYRRSKPPLECHNCLISLNRSDLPDRYDNESIKKFALRCLKDYQKMVKDVEEKIEPMPEDEAMAHAITLYRSAIRYDQKYKEGEVPPRKVARRGEKKRKREAVVALIPAFPCPQPIRWTDQTRSRFSMVRRKCNKNGNFLHWFAEVRKPKEIEGSTISIFSIETDVEAAVVASVVAHIFDTKRDPKNANRVRDKRSKPPLECHNCLISRNRSDLPDRYDNESIRDFALLCLKDYQKMVKNVEEKTEPMPEDEAMAHAIVLYRGAIRYDQKYTEGEVPPTKKTRRGENKRKRDSVESDHDGGDANPRPSRVFRQSLEPEGESLCIRDKKELMLRNRSIAQIKAQWKHFIPDEATWEMEDGMLEAYPSMFHNEQEDSE